MRARVVAGLVPAVVLAAIGAAAGPAAASFPGANGWIAYEWTGESAYRAGPTATSIRAVNPRTRRVQVLRECPLKEMRYTECIVGGPRYSPDGRAIAFPMTRIVPDLTGRRPWEFLPGLGMMTARGSGLQEHLTGDRYVGSLAWSPRGDRLLLDRRVGPATEPARAIFLTSTDGTELRQVTPDGASTPDWAVTGEIAFTGERSQGSCYPTCSNIFTTRLGRAPRRLTHRGGHSPSWSPDGKQLAFLRPDLEAIRRSSYRDNIYVVGRDGRGLHRLTRGGGSGPVWSPDGRRIAFVRRADLYVVKVTGGRPRRVVDAPTPGSIDSGGGQVGRIDWQPLRRATAFY